MRLALPRVLIVLMLGVVARALGWLIREPVVELWTSVATRTAPAGGWTLDRLVAGLAAALAGICVLGLLLSVTVVLLVEACRLTGPTAEAVLRMAGPHWWRRGVLAVCGIGMASTVVAAPALARPLDDHSTGPDCLSCAPRLDGLPWPDLPDHGRTAPAQRRSTVVRPGDSLWGIARTLLGPTASDPSVAHHVAVLYSANRHVIGTDPDLLLPGMKLTLPGGTK